MVKVVIKKFLQGSAVTRTVLRGLIMYDFEANFVYCMAAKAKYYVCELMAYDKESGPFLVHSV